MLQYLFVQLDKLGVDNFQIIRNKWA